jgi:predicted transcriptional regulator
MKRTTISLPDDLAAALEREAVRCRLPVSQIAREALEQRLGFGDAGEQQMPFVGMFDGKLGETASTDFEEYLERHWAEDIERDAFLGSR